MTASCLDKEAKIYKSRSPQSSLEVFLMIFPWSGFGRLKVSEMALSRNDLFIF